jgi:prophage tail gpP-like protein
MSGVKQTATDRITVTIGSIALNQVTHFDLSRDLQDISGTFSVTVIDEKRVIAAAAAISADVDQYPGLIMPGPAVTIAIDGTPVLTGWLEKITGKTTAKSLTCKLAGRDKTGDLVECAAFPKGPTEYRNIGLLAFVTLICAPYGIPVRADVDLGDVFDRLSMSPHETALAAIDKAARQRSVLVVSDGVGGLLLTRGGTTRGAAPIRMGEAAYEGDFDIDFSHRFSHYYVKGQTDSSRQRKGIPAALNSTVQPLSAGGTAVAAPATVTPPTQSATSTASQSILMTGLAIDPLITRWRPTLRLTRTQSGMSSVQEQAEWTLRVAKGRSFSQRYRVLDWRAGPQNALWQPNSVVMVYDPYAGVDADRLIAGVRFTYDEQGERTELRVVDLTAYDRVNEAQKRRSASRPTAKTKTPVKLDSTVYPLS